MQSDQDDDDCIHAIIWHKGLPVNEGRLDL
jgi:hypothetical protein